MQSSNNPFNMQNNNNNNQQQQTNNNAFGNPFRTQGNDNQQTNNPFNMSNTNNVNNNNQQINNPFNIQSSNNQQSNNPLNFQSSGNNNQTFNNQFSLQSNNNQQSNIQNNNGQQLYQQNSSNYFGQINQNNNPQNMNGNISGINQFNNANIGNQNSIINNNFPNTTSKLQIEKQINNSINNDNLYENIQSPQQCLNKDFVKISQPIDTVSSLKWSPANNILAASNWGSQIEIYQISSPNNRARSNLVTTINTGKPMLSIDWKNDGSAIFMGGSDNQVKIYDVNQNNGNPINIGMHNSIIQSVVQIPEINNGILISASLDRTIKFWDLRQQNPAITLNLPENIFGMDAAYPHMGVIMAKTRVNLFNLAEITQNSNVTPQYDTLNRSNVNPKKKDDMTIQYNLTSIACFPKGFGQVIGGVDGRCFVRQEDKYFTLSNNLRNTDNATKTSFTFKAHRTGNQSQPVNFLTLSKSGMLATGGHDGTCVIWDKEKRKKIDTYPQASDPGQGNNPNQINPQYAFDAPLTAGSFSCCTNNNATFHFALATGYDWHQGSYECGKLYNGIWIVDLNKEGCTPKN